MTPLGTTPAAYRNRTKVNGGDPTSLIAGSIQVLCTRPAAACDREPVTNTRCRKQPPRYRLAGKTIQRCNSGQLIAGRGRRQARRNQRPRKGCSGDGVKLAMKVRRASISRGSKVNRGIAG